MWMLAVEKDPTALAPHKCALESRWIGVAQLSGAGNRVPVPLRSSRAPGTAYLSHYAALRYSRLLASHPSSHPGAVVEVDHAVAEPALVKQFELLANIAWE